MRMLLRTIISALFVLSFCSPSLSSDFSVSLGYDSNPASERDRSDSSFFEEFSFGFSGSFFGLDVLGGGQFLDYFDVPDAFFFSFEAKKRLFEMSSLLNFHFFSGFSAYRNGLVTEDENNSYYLGVSSSFFLSDRLNMDFIFRIDRREFLHFDTVKRYFRHRNRSSSHGRKSPGMVFKKVSRHDLGYFFEIGPSLLFSHAFLSFSMLVNKNDSSFEIEDYFSAGFSFDFSVLFSTKLFIDLSFLWKKLDYDKAPRKIDRVDYFRLYYFRLSYDLANSSNFYVQIEHVDNQSPLWLEDYKKTTIKCGFVFYF